MMYREDTGRINISAGTLDDADFFKPTAHIYCETRQSWLCLDPDVPSYPAQADEKARM